MTKKNPYGKSFLIVCLFLSNTVGRSFKRHTAFVQTSRSVRSIAVKAYRSKHLDIKRRWMHRISLTSLSLTNTYTCICACSKTGSRFPSVQNGLDSSHCYSLLSIFVHGTWQNNSFFQVYKFFFIYLRSNLFLYNKNSHHITEILLKVALNTIKSTNISYKWRNVSLYEVYVIVLWFELCVHLS